jgi:hypothetical protein
MQQMLCIAQRVIHQSPKVQQETVVLTECRYMDSVLVVLASGRVTKGVDASVSSSALCTCVPDNGTKL